MSKTVISDLIKSNIDRYGKNIYIFGTADFGPTNCPVKIKSISHLYSVFGRNGSLVDSYIELISVTTDVEIYLCKVTGSHSVAKLNINSSKGEVYLNSLILKSKYSNSIFNDVSVTILNDSFIIKNPERVGGKEFVYKYSEFPTIDALISKINDDCEAGEGVVEAFCAVNPTIDIIGALDTVNPTEIYLYGGKTGCDVSKNELYLSLEYTFQLLEGVCCDIAILADMFVDDIETPMLEYGQGCYGVGCYSSIHDTLTLKNNDNNFSFYNLLLKFCATQTILGLVTLGVIGFNKIEDKYVVKDVQNFTNKYILNSMKANYVESYLEPYRHLVQVVAGDLTNIGSGYTGNGYLHYAATLASSYISDGITNKVVGEDIFLHHEFENEQLIELAENGVVAFRHSVTKDSVVVSGAVTSALDGGPYSYVHNLRVVQFAVSCVKDISDLVIGEDINVLVANGLLKRMVDEALAELDAQNILEESYATVTVVAMNEIQIELSLKTCFTIDFIKTSFVVKKGEVK